MNRKHVLYLSQEDVLHTKQLLPEHSNKIIETSFSLVGQDDFLMGGATASEHGLMLHFPKDSIIPNMPLYAPDYRYMAMVGYVGGDFHICGTKIYGSNVKNVERKLPRSNHIILLNDVETGLPVAIMNGTQISNMRTGAVAGVAAKHLAPATSRTAGLIGAGAVNRTVLTCLTDALPKLERVYVYDRLPEKMEAFIKDMGALPVELVRAASEQEMLPQCDVLHYATTAIPPFPNIEPSLLKPGALVEISCLVDYPDQLLNGTNIVVDLLRMHEIWYETDPGQNLATYPVLDKLRSGELQREHVKELGKIINGTQTLAAGGKTTLFMANGLPVWDVALAYAVYQAAKAKGIGMELPL